MVARVQNNGLSRITAALIALNWYLAVACASFTAIARSSAVQILATCSSALTVLKLIDTKIAIQCAAAVLTTRSIGKRVALVCGSAVSRPTKIATKTVNIAVLSLVSVIARFILTPIRTAIYGRASAPAEIAGEEEPTRIAGRASGVHIDGYPEPINPDTEF